MTAAWNSSATNTLHQTGISSGRLPGALGVSAESEWVQLRLGGNTRRRHLRVGLTDDGNKRAASEVGEQWLGDPCFMAVDCAPGLFAVIKPVSYLRILPTIDVPVFILIFSGCLVFDRVAIDPESPRGVEVETMPACL